MTPPSRLPPRYLCELRLFAWRDIAWGVARGLLTYGDVVRLAMYRADERSSPAELALATLEPEYEWAIEPALDAVVTEEASPGDDSADRWLFAILLYDTETATTAEGLLKLVEDTFCEFGHPAEMYDFVPYMPPQDGYDPTRHTLEQNRRRLVTLMHAYLTRTAAKFGVRAPVGPLHHS